MTETSQEQLKANKANAQLGGVKTEEGKAISKLNALKHGLLSKDVLLEGEDEDSLIALSINMRSELKPSGEVESLLTDRIITNTWRLKRLLKVESSNMEWHRDYELYEALHFGTSEKQTERKAVMEMIANEDTEKLLRYEAAIERSIYKALHELLRLQSTRNGNVAPLPLAIDLSSDKE